MNSVSRGRLGTQPPCQELINARSGMNAVAGKLGGNHKVFEDADHNLFIYNDKNTDGVMDQGESLARMNNPDCEGITFELISLTNSKPFAVAPQRDVTVSELATDSTLQQEFADFIKNQSR